MRLNARFAVSLLTLAVGCAAFLLINGCTKRPAPTPRPGPEKVHGSDETALADGDRGRGHSLEDMGFRKSARVASVEFAALYFGLGKDIPLPGQIETLRTLFEETPNYAGCRIIGHTCPIGETSYNASLGYQRAHTVLTILRAAGVRTRMELISYGEEQPVAFTPDEYRLNRRVVVECDK